MWEGPQCPERLRNLRRVATDSGERRLPACTSGWPAKVCGCFWQAARNCRLAACAPQKRRSARDDRTGRLVRLRKRLFALLFSLHPEEKTKGEWTKISTLNFKYGTCLYPRRRAHRL